VDQPAHKAGLAPSRARLLAFGFATFSMVSLGMLGIGELAIRVLAPQPPSWLDIYARLPDLPLYGLMPNVARFAATGETRWSVFTDAQGHRVSKREHEDPARASAGREPAIALGDSFTFAHGVDYEASFVAQLESATRFHFVNTAVPGYGPAQYRVLLQRALDRGLRPKLILLGTFLGNDYQDCIWEKDVPVRNGIVGDPGGLRSVIKRNSHLYRLTANLYHVMVPLRDQGNEALLQTFDPAQWKRGGEMARAAALYAQEMGRIATLARQHGIPLVALVIPAQQSIEARQGHPSIRGLDYARPTVFARTALSELGIAFVDLAEVLAKERVDAVYFSYDGHLTPFGHRLAAEALRAKIAELTGAATTTAARGQ
jgi:hypothetical protein